jgi:hypothetical protein
MRLGVSRMSANPDFGTFVIPGVGEPPVVLFLLLITAFGIALGPVNYFVLRAKRRLYWMFVTVPAAAFLATVGLLGYAVLADGLGVRARVSSVTHVDQLAETASSFSRQAYFAGLAPRGGLRFPVDAMVQPIEFDSNLNAFGRRERETREVEWADRQAFTNGYLASRTLTEWLVVAPQAATFGLRIQMAADGSGACRVRNDLGVGLHSLVICDAQGRQYFTSSLEAGGDRKLEAMEWKDIAPLFRAALPSEPRITSAWEPQRNNPFLFWSRQSRSGSFETSLLNFHRRKVVGIQPFETRRGYLALAEQPLATPLGTTPNDLVHDLHIVVGAW